MRPEFNGADGMQRPATEGKPPAKREHATKPGARTERSGRGSSTEIASSGELLDSIPPSNPQIELELLGMLFVAGGDKAFELLEPEDFHDPMRAFLFGELKAAWTAKVPFQTEGALLEWMKRRAGVGRMNAHFGEGWAYEFALGMERGLPCNVGYYCSILRDLRKRRLAIHLCLTALRGAYNDSVSAPRWRKRVGQLLEKFDETKQL